MVVLLLAGLLHAGVCAFTWCKFTMFDYGVYTNMIWNSGRGDLFLCLIDRSYLGTHLSFTLALLGPLFRVWDHPFLLWLIQWIFLAGGTAILARTAFRLGMRPPITAAIVVFFAGYHFTQQAALSEFHGVSLYLILVPWLYYCLRLRRSLIWLPWLLILGVREDAAVVVLPLLLYFAIRERWGAGYVYAALSVGYMALAITAIFPALTGMDLASRRQADIGSNPLAHLLDPATLVIRLKALGWIVLPALPFVRRGDWIPLVVFPSLALLQAMGGGTRYQYQLALHYAAPVVACLAVAMLDTYARRGATGPAWGRWGPLLPSLALLLITAVSYRAGGFLPGGSQQQKCYARINESGVRTLRAARRIPREGVLLCSSRFAGFCANRRDITDSRHFDPARHRVDLVFSDLQYCDDEGSNYRIWTDNGFGLIYFDGWHVVLQRGADPAPNYLLFEGIRRVKSGTPDSRPPGNSGPGLSLDETHSMRAGVA